MANLVGIHDIEGFAIAPDDTWILDTIALSESDAGKIYATNKHWIVRVNWGYGSTGTIPLPADDNLFAARLANYVSRSNGCHRFIVGNEPNLPREWPQGQAIHPYRYAEFYQRCREIILKISGHEQDEVLIAGSGPWNDQYKYSGNVSGDWIKYFTDVFGAMPQEKIDGFSIHAYTHGYDPQLVTSEAMMNHPFQNRHYNFRTYRDYCNAIPDSLAHLPVYITEANGNGPWQARGLIPEMAKEIDTWNHTSRGRKIFSLIFYRYPDYDSDIKFHMAGKEDVLKEYRQAVALNIQSPKLTGKIFMPTTPNQTGRTVAVKATELNVRDRPGVNNTNIVGSRFLGDKVTVLEEVFVEKNLWYRIGPNQWVAAAWTESAAVPNNQSNWERVKQFTSGWEGGFQDLDWDAGNWTGCEVGKGIKKGTNFGISACSYPNLDIRNITRKQAEEIFFRDYWQRSGASEQSWPMCLLVYDTAVNFGAVTASIWLEQSKGNMLRFCALRLKGYRKSRAWPQAGNAWVDRTIDLMLEASE